MLGAGGRRVVLAAIVGLSGLSVPTVVHADPGPAATSLTGAPSAAVARVGDRVVVRGSVTATAARDVQLQQLVGRSWRRVADVDSTGTFAVNLPTDSPGVGTYRLLAPATGTHAAGSSATFTVGVGEGDTKSHAFLTTPPVRWDPCTVVGYRVNLAGAPQGALDDVRAAVAQASTASGVNYRYLGTTKVVHGARSTSVPDEYPDGTHLVIAYTTPSRTKFLEKRTNALGVAGVFYDLEAQKVGGRSWHRAVQGYVVINTTKNLPGGFGRGRASGELGTWGQVLMHEVGHTLGLDHPKTGDRAQIMYPETTYKEARWGAGDLAGLRRLGAVSGCFASGSGATAAGPQNPMTAGIGH